MGEATTIDADKWAGVAEVLRQRAGAILDADDCDDDRRDDAELMRVLSRLLAGQRPSRAFGAPGDWGYGSPIGRALAAAYKAGAV